MISVYHLVYTLMVERLGQSSPLIALLGRFRPTTLSRKNLLSAFQIFDLAKSIPWCNSISALHCGEARRLPGFGSLDVLGEAQ